MPKLKGGLRQDANFTEDAVGLAIESFLTLFSFPRFRFSVVPFSRSRERYLGADARLAGQMVGFRPFYMQFKRPSAYPDFSNAGLVRERKKFGLETQPVSLFFGLRDKSKHHRDFQHNILFALRERLRRRGIGDAAYVCPLFLDRSAYRFHVHVAGLTHWPRFWRFDPWEWERVFVNTSGRSIQFDRVPVLAEHVSVPPHATVGDAKHRYSFNERGGELCFHSPKSLPEGSLRLSAFLKAIARDFLDGGDMIRAETANKELRDLFFSQSDQISPRIPFEFSPDADPIGNWLSWGSYLRDEYEIDQFAFVMWQDG